MAVHKTFSSAAAAVNHYGNIIEEELESTMKTAASEGLKAAVNSTPVDEGTARSNWVTSTKAPVVATRSPFAKGSHLGIGETANANATINDGNARLQRYQIKDGSIYISNSTPYIGDLNDGSSAQSPGNMDMMAISAIVSVVSRATVLGKFRASKYGKRNIQTRFGAEKA